jgi:hypothetical protein
MFGVLGVKCTVASLPTNHALQQYPTVHVVTPPMLPLVVQESVPISATRFPNACPPRMQRQPDPAPTCPAPYFWKNGWKNLPKRRKPFSFPIIPRSACCKSTVPNRPLPKLLSPRNSYLRRRDKIIPYSSITQRTDSANRDSNFGLSHSSLARGLNVLPLPFPFLAVPKR